jgi:hypothetical protein
MYQTQRRRAGFTQFSLIGPLQFSMIGPTQSSPTGPTLFGMHYRFYRKMMGLSSLAAAIAYLP